MPRLLLIFPLAVGCVPERASGSYEAVATPVEDTCGKDLFGAGTVRLQVVQLDSGEMGVRGFPLCTRDKDLYECVHIEELQSDTLHFTKQTTLWVRWTSRDTFTGELAYDEDCEGCGEGYPCTTRFDLDASLMEESELEE